MAKPPPTLLLSFDFDGTLVSHESEPAFHPMMRDVLKDLQRRGAVWLINTGRGLGQTLEGLAQHGVFLTPDYIIARECEIFRPGWLRPWTDFGSWNRRARKVHDQFIDKHLTYFEELRDVVTRHSKAEFIMRDFGEVGIVASNPEELDFICEHIEKGRQQFPEVSYHRNGIYLRFSHTDFSKGTALQELARLLKVPRENIFAGGDNFNDVTMLDHSVAGHIACPSNALDPIKLLVRERGGYVAGKVASEGMAEALLHFFGEMKR